MKINEIADVVQHPAVAKEVEFTTLLQSGESSMDDIVEFIMDDRNAEERRLSMLRHLDGLLGGVKDSYDVGELQDFMYDQDDPSEPPKRHLRVVEQPDDDIPTGEYEICQICDGEGCIECEEGLKDITGMNKIPDFGDLDNA